MINAAGWEIDIKSILAVLIFGALWVFVIFNRKLKRDIRKAAGQLGLNRKTPAWGRDDCACGCSRSGWKPLAMLRPENVVLLMCPGCGILWEELMDIDGNRWRPVEVEYAREYYGFREEMAIQPFKNKKTL